MLTNEINLLGLTIPLQNQFGDYLNKYIQTTIAPQYQAEGYEIQRKEGFPLGGEKKIHPVYKALKSFNTKIRYDSNIGTQINLSWEKERLDRLQIETKTSTSKKTLFMVLFSIIFSLIAYGLTVIYYEFWVVVFVSLFVCFLITAVLVVLPGVIGVVLGMVIGSMVFNATISKENRAQNQEDAEDIHEKVIEYANTLLTWHRNQYNIPIQPA